jgi:hypothetical protein
MKISLLHISDLHRDPANPISNTALLDSLDNDRSALYRRRRAANQVS